MNKSYLSKFKNRQFPVFVEKDEDDFYVVECPYFQGCYTQGKTIDQALDNIKEVIEICLEEKENQRNFENYVPAELSLHTVALA